MSGLQGNLSATRELLNEAVRHLDAANLPAPPGRGRAAVFQQQSRRLQLPQDGQVASASHDAGSPAYFGQTEFQRTPDRKVMFPYRPFNKGLATKRPQHSAPRSKKRKVAMWEKEFICLARVGQSHVPTPLDKAELIRAGLGMGSLLLFEHSDAWEFHDEILRKFPKLTDGGGYELLRTCGNSRELHVIPPPSGGYTTSYVKSVANQAKLYVRPLQKDLSLEETKSTGEMVC